MKTLSLFFVGFLLATNFLFAQSQTASWALLTDNKGNGVCPNTQLIYSAYVKDLPVNYTFGCRFQWRVEGGYFPLYNNATSANTQTIPRIDVVFNTNASTAKLYLTTTGCDTTKSNTPKEQPFDIFLRTVSTETPTVSGTSPLQEQKGIRPATLTVNRVQVPNTGQWGDISGITSSIYADAYEWTLPANRPNWYFPSNPMQRVIRTSSPTVSVMLDALNAGEVSVRAVISTCVPNNFSKPLSLPIERITPSIGAISTTNSRNLITTDGKIACATVDTITLTTTLPQGLTARHYKWRFSAAQGAWKFISPTGALQDTLTTFAPTAKAVSTANTEPTIGVLANINYSNAMFENSKESFIAIKINRIQAKISSATAKKSDLCLGEIAGTIISTVGQNATSFSYENLSPRTISIIANPTDNSCLVTTISAGVGQVKVTAINACGIGESKIVQIGIYEGAPFNSGVFNQPKDPYCPNQVSSVVIEEVQNTISYQWISLSRDMFVSGYGTQGYIIPRKEGNHSFAVITSNPCASDTTIYQIYANYRTCGLQPWQNQVAIYPNPVQDVMNIILPSLYSETLSIKLYDAMGQVRKTVPSQNIDLQTNTISFSVADLPIGTYFLHIIDQDMLKQYQVLIVR